MFDVSWTDPERETVGERRTRKEQNGGSSRKQNVISRRSSMRSSKSTESPAAAKPSLLNIFGSGRKPAIDRAKSQSKLYSEDVNDHRVSIYTSGSETSAPESFGLPATRIASNSFFDGRSSHSDTEQSNPSEPPDSVFSGWTERTSRTDSSWGSVIDTSTLSSGTSSCIVQPLSPTSFVTQSTEVTVSPRDSIKAEEQTATIVRITAAGTTIPVEVSNVPDSPTKTYVPLYQATSPVAETWKPPETWECPASSSDSSGCSLSPTAKTHPRPRRDIQKPRLKSPPTSAEILHLQRSIRRMEAASKKIMLERLREEWTEIADASVYRELELEKQMWMLTALRSFDGRRSIDGSRCGTPVWHRGKVLSLFENHASASSLVAIVPKGTEVHHLSTAPLSPKQYLNILPLTVPSATPQLPYASNIFSSIHAFCLPSLLPSSSIPAVLKECYRVLVSAPKPSQSTTPSSNTLSNSVEPRGGTLCLTILDPSPLPGTLGPRLRTWLDDHLVLNLEKQFRCINPSRLLPDWLADAGLRAKGSTVMYVKFFASVPNLEDERIKQELKSVVGRMLWKEMWGSYVLGEKWWWEDEEVVDECERMGTVWEYAVIEAVKGE
ncbi:uncharacterized protein LY89DRAFT_577391 [Mollisia scopiformis]|uniref:Uncharacterized protein n=1 Tax=Mollisia scopiformis TaxID=149040 RepID=A0A194XMQ1_MOLSC|nr:uncharacterized protein LY89DRAFT_577391 [Mollisia scopiformis]KUJ21433.1 hypothetical protein LY89DRAFT_577391 [Mollisia scopiformis]